MSNISRLYSFEDLAETVPFSKRTLREKLRELGYIGDRRTMAFTYEQAIQIQEALSCRKRTTFNCRVENINHSPSPAELSKRARRLLDKN